MELVTDPGITGHMARLIALLDGQAALVDGAGRVLAMNPEFEGCLAMPAAAIRRDGILHLLQARSAQRFRDFVERSTPRSALFVETAGAGGGAPVRLSVKAVPLGYGVTIFLLQAMQQRSIIDSKLRFFVEQLDHGVWEYDTRGDVFIVSPKWRQIRGLSPDAPIDARDGKWLNYIHEEDRQALRDAFDGQTRGDAETIRMEYRSLHAQGHWVWILCRGSIIEVDTEGKPLRIVGTDTDITEIKQKENELSQLTSKLQLAIEASGMGIWEFDPVNAKVHWDDRMLDIYGVTDGQNERSDRLWETYLHPDDQDEMIAYAAECRRTNSDFKRDYRVLRPDGTVRHVRSMARMITSRESFGRLVGVNIDVTEDYRRAEELEKARTQLEYDSRHDALTGLANRRLLDETAESLFETMEADDHYAVMHLDLDHFKQINDTLGHAAGDLVLRHVACLLQEVVGEQALISRLGGDEFALLFADAPDEWDLVEIGERILTTFEAPVLYDGQACRFGGSLGIALGKGRPRSASDIFVQADAALYAAKNAGRGCVRVYRASSGQAALRGPRCQPQDLIAAIDASGLLCHFQPQIDPHSLEMIGAEALVRWPRADQGVLVPDQFLPMAKAADLVGMVDTAVLDYVLACQDGWFERGIDYPAVSLNVSGDELLGARFADRIAARLSDHHRIRFELLETSFLDGENATLTQNLEKLRDVGIAWDLDDFGSGHASVVALQRIRPNRVKIDRQLVAPIVDRPAQLGILEAMIGIARLEGAGVVVEGVETDAHLAMVRDIGCDAVQGYALSAPVPARQFEALLAAGGGFADRSAVSG